MQRYDFDQRGIYCGCGVRYPDHAAEIAAKDAEIARLTSAVAFRDEVIEMRDTVIESRGAEIARLRQRLTRSAMHDNQEPIP